MASRTKSKRLANAPASLSQPSGSKTYSSRHAAKGTPPAVFAPMGNYNRSSPSSSEGGAGSAVKAEMTSARNPVKKMNSDIIDLCSDEDANSDVNSSLSDDSPSGVATQSTSGSTGSGGRPSRYATRGVAASANKENAPRPAGALPRKSPSPTSTHAAAAPQTPTSLASSTLSRTPATRTPPVSSSGYGNNTAPRVVHSPAASTGPTPSILSSIVSEAGSALGRPPRSRMSSLGGGRRIETDDTPEGTHQEVQEMETEIEAPVEEEPRAEEVEVEVDNDDGLDDDTVLLKASMRELMSRLEEMGEGGQPDCKATLTSLFHALKYKDEAAVFVARDAAALLGRLHDLTMPRMHEDEDDVRTTRRQSVARARMSVAPDAYDTPTGQVEHDSEAHAAVAAFREALTDFRRERRLVTKREAQLAAFQRKADAYKDDLEAVLSCFRAKVCQLEDRLTSLTQALTQKDAEAEALYSTTYLPQASLGRDVWRAHNLDSINAIARQGQALLEEMDSLQTDVDCTSAWLALLTFTRDTLVGTFVTAHSRAVDALLHAETQGLETLKTESACELVELSVEVLKAFSAAQAHKKAELAECDAAVSTQKAQIERLRAMGGNAAGINDQVRSSQEMLTFCLVQKDKMEQELGTLDSEMRELSENDMKDQYAEACRRVAAGEGQQGQEQGKGEEQEGGEEDECPEMRNCLIM